LLEACRGFSRITIGLTSDAYVRKHKIYPSFPYAKRLLGLKAVLGRLGLEPSAAIVKIDSESAVADRIEADAIIVSEETRGGAVRINRMRKKRGLASLRIISVPLAYGENLKKISCLDIYREKTDLKGRICAPLQVQAGTDNPTKLSGAARALARVFGKKFALKGHKEDSRVSHHPFNAETFLGAKNRAHAAWKRAWGAMSEKRGSAPAASRAKRGCDYSLGMESGLFALSPGLHIDITICCIYDGERETYGTGMGFVVPEWIVKRIRTHGSDLSKVMREVAGESGIGRREGALGWFSNGVFHRRDQIETAVACAFVPRIAEAKKGMHY
jgi:pantetheine-phosphate adenylyltransferase